MAAVLGFIMGPCFGIGMSFLQLHYGIVRIDGYTGPGYLQTLFTVVMVILTKTIFKEIPYKERPGRDAET